MYCIYIYLLSSKLNAFWSSHASNSLAKLLGALPVAPMRSKKAWTSPWKLPERTFSAQAPRRPLATQLCCSKIWRNMLGASPACCTERSSTSV